MSLHRCIPGFFAALALLLLLGFAMPAPALADDLTGNVSAATTPPPAKTGSVSSGDTTSGYVSKCSNYVGLTNRIAGCIRDTLDNVTSAYYGGFYLLLSRAISALITLAVVVYGMMAASGRIEKLGRDSIMLATKIALVSFFVINSDVMYYKVTDMMDAVSSTVVKFTPGSGQSVSAANGTGQMGQSECINQMRLAQRNATVIKAPVGPWMGMDCVIDSVIGIKVKPKATISAGSASIDPAINSKLDPSKQGMSRGMLYLFFSSMKTSIFGVVLAVLGMLFIYGMIFMIIKALFTYIVGYLGIAFLMIVSPLFIPLVLFQSTKSYFEKWVKLVISFTMQPIIILVFITMMIAAVDLATFSGDYSLMYRIAGDDSRKPGFNLNTYLENAGAIVAKNPQLAQVNSGKEVPELENCETNGAVVGLCYSKKCKPEYIQEYNGPKDPKNPQKNKNPTYDPAIAKYCAAGLKVKLLMDGINWENLAAARQPPVVFDPNVLTAGQQLAREMLASVMFCGIVIFIMNGLLKVVPMLTQDLMGDFAQTPNLFKPGSKLPGQKMLNDGARKLSESMASMVGNRSNTAGGPK